MLNKRDRQILYMNIQKSEVLIKIKNILFVALFLFIGLFIFFHPVFLSTDLMPGDLGDARFINYVLEHGYLYLKGNALHSNFWDMPIFYPLKNTLAFSDILLGGMIIYIPVRFFFNPQTSLQIWLFIVCILNYFSMYFLLAKYFKFNPLSSSLGAFIFAFSLPRYAQIYHMQLYLHFYTVFSVICFISLKKDNSKLKNNLLFFFGVSLLALQLYSSFYLGWFTIFASFLFLIIFLMFKKTRLKIFDFIKFYKKELLIYSVIFFLAVYPMCYHYLAVGTQFEFFDFDNLKIKSFLDSGSLIDILFFKSTFGNDCEQHLGIGYITTLFLIFGMFFFKHRKYCLIFFISVILIFSFLPSRYVLYNIFPGACAIRASSRIILLFLLFYSVFIAQFTQSIKNKFLLFFIVTLIVFEQIPARYHFEWSKKEHAKRLSVLYLDKSCKVVSYYMQDKKNLAPVSGFVLLDIIWFALSNNVYTTNGYSGYVPDKIESENIDGLCKYVVVSNKYFERRDK